MHRILERYRATRYSYLEVIFLASCISILTAPSSKAQASETIGIGGTGSALTTMKHIVEAYRRTGSDLVANIVPNLGSGGGIKATAAGAIDLGLSARPLKVDEQAHAIMAHEVARTPLVIATAAPKAPINISQSELVGMIDGTRFTWPDGSRLRYILRPKTDAEHTLLSNLSPQLATALDKAHASQSMNIAATDQDAADTLEQIPGSIGTTTLALIMSEKRPLKILSLDGVRPSVESIRDGRYRLYKPLYLVTVLNPKPQVRAIIAFIESAEGAQLLIDNGYFAVKSTPSP